ncbi:MAG TPA: IclR family transcriptional regulator [Gaiellaceae bacterium]|nr:IclR family transcriptional regulator [Gaiellaceae bacterium]
MTPLENGAQSIDRAARILVRLVESDEAVTLSGVMEETQLAKSTAARLLRALERNGLAQRRPGGGFRPGPVLVDYARRDASVGDLATLARPFLERLEQTTGETTNVAIPTPSGVARLAQVDSHHPLGAGNWVGRRIPPHASSLGKVFMAFGAAQPPTGRLAKLASNTITNIADLMAELEQVRRRGYATTWDELEDGLCSTAAPIRGSGGKVIAAISVSAPTVRMTREQLEALAEQVVDAADALSNHIRTNRNGGNE